MDKPKLFSNKRPYLCYNYGKLNHTGKDCWHIKNNYHVHTKNDKIPANPQKFHVYPAKKNMKSYICCHYCEKSRHTMDDCLFMQHDDFDAVRLWKASPNYDANPQGPKTSWYLRKKLNELFCRCAFRLRRIKCSCDQERQDTQIKS